MLWKNKDFRFLPWTGWDKIIFRGKNLKTSDILRIQSYSSTVQISYWILILNEKQIFYAKYFVLTISEFFSAFPVKEMSLKNSDHK